MKLMKRKSIHSDELETLPRYSILPDKLKTRIAKVHNELKKELEPIFNKIRINKDFSNEQLLNELYKDEIVDDTILKVGRHTLKIDNELIDEGYNTEVRTTNKKLILLNTTSSNYPAMSHELKIRHIAKESFKEFSISNKDIKSINIDMSNKIICESILERFSIRWLAIVGVAIFFLGIFLNPGLAVLWVTVAVLLVIVAWLLKSYSIIKGDKDIQIARKIRLAVVEPFYGRRALLTLNVSDEHSIRDIVSWITHLQNKI